MFILLLLATLNHHKSPLFELNGIRVLVHQSPHTSTAPTLQISMKCDDGDFYKSLWGKLDMVKIGQKYQALYMDM
jgi:hypothetical protein